MYAWLPFALYKHVVLYDVQGTHPASRGLCAPLLKAFWEHLGLQLTLNGSRSESPKLS